MNVNIKVHNVKSIKEADIDLPLEKGMYAIVGENGCGKSTLMLVMSFMVKTSSNRMLSNALKNGITEIDFIKYLADDIYDYEKLTTFVTALTKMQRNQSVLMRCSP